MRAIDREGGRKTGDWLTLLDTTAHVHLSLLPLSMPRAPLPPPRALCHHHRTPLHPAPQSQVILTTYDVVRVDWQVLLGLQPHVVIFDEAQRLKSTKSKQYEAAMQLTRNCSVFGLSGARGLIGRPAAD